MYDMYPAWDEPAETAARNGTHNSTSNGTENGSSEDATPSTRVEHIRGPRTGRAHPHRRPRRSHQTARR